MPRKPATEIVRIPKYEHERRAKSQAEDRMAGKIEPLSAMHAPVRRRTKEAAKKPEDLKKAKSTKTMVKMAIKDNADRKGTSLQALYNYIEANYAVKDNYRRYLKLSLAKQVEAGILVKRSPIRYSLSAKAKKTPAKSPKKEKKSTASPKKKGTKKATTKKVTEKKASPKKTTKMSVEKTPKAGARTTRAATAKTTRATTKTTKTPKAKAKATRSTTAKAKTTRSTKEGAEASDKTESEGSGKLIWVWQYYNNGFYNYDSDASDVVEGVYQEYLSSPYTCDVRAVKSGDWEYEIDFRIMTQRNLRHEAHTSRPIRRIQIPDTEKSDRKKKYEGTPDEPKSSSSSSSHQ